MERATSAPNSQGGATEASGTATSTDKKRNKLGYHRTSVACVHCRRRKIRCLVAQDDAQGRCENCIRLKKECQYLSVDQQPMVEKKSHPNLRAMSTSAEHLTISQPSRGAGGPSGQREPFPPYQAMPFPTNQKLPISGTATYPGDPMAPFPSDGRIRPPGFAASPSLESSAAWGEFASITDPQALAIMKSSMMGPQQSAWSTDRTSAASIQPSSPALGVPPVQPESQAMDAGTGLLIHPNQLWSVQTVPPMVFPAPPAMTGAYAAQLSSNAPSGIKDLQMSVTDQVLFPDAPPTSLQEPIKTDQQVASIPIMYAGQQPAMNFPMYQDSGALHQIATHHLFPGDTSQQPNFGQPPMGHPNQRHHTSQP